MGFLAERKARRAVEAAAVRAADEAHRAAGETEQAVREGVRLRRAREFEAAERTLAEAVRSGAERLGPDAPAVLRGAVEHGRTLVLTLRWADAEPVLRAAADRSAADLPRQLTTHLDARQALGSTLLGLERPAEAAAELEAYHELLERHEVVRSNVVAPGELAKAYGRIGRYSEAALLYAELATELEAEQGRSGPAVLQARGRLAATLLALGHLEQAQRAARAVIRAATADTATATATAADNPDAVGRWTASAVLARTLAHQGAGEEGEAAVLAAIADCEQLGGPGARALDGLREALAEILNGRGRHQEALDLVTGLLAARAPRRQRAASAVLHADRAAALLGLGRPEDARQAVEQAVADCRAALGPRSTTALATDTLHGRVLAALGRTDEARAALTANAAAWREHYGPEHFRTREAERELAALEGESAP
ncbi:tetratricopeptide repeat protein [Kitasatospora phosalacinea]|uniref:tetratricopeptide repeat protein n=1 Tax=Kitasatospora phosalacinea TaxID=2065 RepID=UPI00365912DC